MVDDGNVSKILQTFFSDPNGQQELCRGMLFLEEKWAFETHTSPHNFSSIQLTRFF